MDPVSAKMALQVGVSLVRNRGTRYLVVGLVLLTLATNVVLIFSPWMLTAQTTAAQRAQQLSTTDAGRSGTPETVYAFFLISSMVLLSISFSA